MSLLNQCSRILSKRSLIPSLPKWYKGKQSGTKFNYNYGAVGLLGAAICSVGAVLADGQISADELELNHAHMHWEHTEFLKSYDHKALRRGFQVYKDVCQACHSLQYIYWRMHVDVTHTKPEIKEIAAEYMYPDVDEDTGKVTERPGNVNDLMPSPYKNEIEARLNNNGAEPPDLTLVTLAREGGENYIYSILTGYEEVPAGQAEPAEDQAYNPYFHGYYIGMTQQLYNESVDYEDGTIPYQSQIAKDVVQYLAFTSNPYMDITKMYGLKACISSAFLILVSYWVMRTRRSTARTRQVYFSAPGYENKITKNANISNFTKYDKSEKILKGWEKK